MQSPGGFTPLGALAPVPNFRNQTRYGTITVGQEAFNILNAQFAAGLLAPVENAIGQGLGLSSVNLTLGYYGNVGVTATRLLGKTVSAVYATTFGIPQIQSFGIKVQPSAYTSASLSFFYQTGPTRIYQAPGSAVGYGAQEFLGQPLLGESGFSFTLKRYLGSAGVLMSKDTRPTERTGRAGSIAVRRLARSAFGGAVSPSANLTKTRGRFFRMTFDLRRRVRALMWWAGALPLLAMALALTVGPAWSQTNVKIVSVDVTGNLHVPTQTIMAVVAARPGQSYDPRVVQADLARINALGYFADIAPPLVRQRPGGVAITYRVVENPVISKITFSGNQKVPSDTLLALMDLSVGQVFNTNTFRQDVLKINNYYERIGYGGQVPTHVKDLNLDPSTGALTLVIQEGLVVKHIIIGGDPLLPPNLILPALTLKPGQVFSDEIRDADYKALQKLYEDKFHLELGNFEGGIDPSTIDQKARTADVKYNIYVARIAVVEITGNTRTKDAVIRRELRVHPGMVLNTDAIKRDYSASMRWASSPRSNPISSPGPIRRSRRLVTLVWHVTEQRTATASVGFGYSGGLTGQGLYGTLGLLRQQLARHRELGVGSGRKGRAHERRADLGLDPVPGRLAAGLEVQRRRIALCEQLDLLLSDLQHRDDDQHSVGRRNAGADSGNALPERFQLADQQPRRHQFIRVPSAARPRSDAGSATTRSCRLQGGAQTIRYNTTVPRRTTSKEISRTSSSVRRPDRSTRRPTATAARSALPRLRSPTSTPGQPYKLNTATV